MVVERELLPFSEWFLPSAGSIGALVTFLAIIALLSVLALVVSFLVATVRYGPLKAGDMTYRVVSTGVRELFQFSPRRVWALARLAIQESFRRRVLVAVIVFVVILLFAGWFMKTDYKEPGRLFVSFVMIATTYLILGIALLVSAFSLPADIKSKTLHTVVTKPVRAGEIVLGRILGFTIVGTILLLVMGIFSYIFVVRSLDHTHQLDQSSVKNIPAPDNTIVGKEGQTTQDGYHRHSIEQNELGEWYTTENYGHTHDVTSETGSASDVVLSGPQGFLQARVPQYGTLRFVDRQGSPKDRGISVGNEWTYRSFIEGRTAAAAYWTFSGIREADHPKRLDLELIVRVFRSHKGIIGEGIHGEIFLRNPGERSTQSEADYFEAKDDMINFHSFPRKLRNTNGEEIDLFEDLVSDDGRIEVWVQCVDPGQYFGFAQADCYLHLANASPFWNFWKAHISIWVQMVLVIGIGVACSTIVSGPIAALFTVGIILLGFNKASFLEIAEGTNYGGGPIESLVRLITQMNMISPLDPGVGTTLIKSGDAVIRAMMWAVAQVLPDFPRFNTTNYVAEGFNIPANQVGQDLLICLAYVAGLFVVGYFFLRTREVAK